VPLCAGVQDPQDGLQDGAGRYRFAAEAAFGDVFLGKVFPNPFSLIVTQSQHAGAV